MLKIQTDASNAPTQMLELNRIYKWKGSILNLNLISRQKNEIVNAATKLRSPHAIQAIFFFYLTLFCDGPSQ